MTVVDSDPFSNEAFWRWRRLRDRVKDKGPIDAPIWDGLVNAWPTAQPEARCRMLSFLMTANPDFGFAYALEALKDPSAYVRKHGIITVMSYAHHGRNLEHNEVELLKRVAVTRRDKFQGIFAIHALDAAGVDGLDDWLRQLSRSSIDWQIRKQAYLTLLWRGERTSLLPALREILGHPADDWGMEIVWRDARRWELTPEEQRLLMAAADHEADLMRRLADKRGPADSGPDMMRLTNWLLAGVVSRPGDVERISAYILGDKKIGPKRRVDAIRALGLIGSEAANGALRGLLNHPRQFVREAAAKALRARPS